MNEHELRKELAVCVRAASAADYQAKLYETAFNLICDQFHVAPHTRVGVLNQAMKEIKKEQEHKTFA